MNRRALVGSLAVPMLLVAACDTDVELATFAPDPFDAARLLLKVTAAAEPSFAIAGDTITVRMTIHNPTDKSIPLDRLPECLITSVHVVLVSYDLEPAPRERFPLIGTGPVECASGGSSVIFPGDTIVVTHRIVGFLPDDSVNARWRNAPQPRSYDVQLQSAPLRRTVVARIRFQRSGYHLKWGGNCDPLETPPDTARVVVNPRFAVHEVSGTQVQFEVHDTRPNPTRVQACSWWIRATVDRKADSGWIEGSYVRFCTADGPGSAGIGPSGCLRGVKYFRPEAEGTYRLRVATWSEELVSDPFLVTSQMLDTLP